MGLLVKGEWRDHWYDTASAGGRFVRQESGFRSQVRADGSGGFPAEPGRYHLYVSLACPWSHRTVLVRALKGLEPVVGMSVVDPYMGEDGWWFSDGPGCTPDPVNGVRYLHELYTLADPEYTGRVTVPVLWDKETGTLVNNESSDIIRMLNSEFDAFTREDADFYPPELRDGIDEVNGRVYSSVNNGVYRCGFATTQAAYAEAFEELFGTLDQLEERLAGSRYLVGGRITEADWRLFVTLVRFDPVYHTHFKCNLRRIVDYPNLWGYLRDLYQVPGVAATVNMDHIKQHYYRSHKTINPAGIVPLGPALDLDAPHGRGAR